jgi:hypothetical protein
LARLIFRSVLAGADGSEISLPVEGTGKTVQGSGEGQEGVGEGGTDQVASVGLKSARVKHLVDCKHKGSSTHRDVTTLVVRVDSDVQSHQLDKLLVVAETEQSSQVGRVVLVLVNGGELAVTVDVSEDTTSDVGELGNEVHGVIEGGLPVFTLVDTVRVGLGESGVVVELGSGLFSV